MADDYMSDAFLLGLEDVRPGLKSRSQKRKDKASEKSITEPKHKRLKASEHEARSKGLATHISSENKGFSMLQKMGYKKGMGLGKTGAGITTPLPIQLKEDKGGLGRDIYVKEKVEERKEKESHRFQDFRERKQGAFCDRRLEADLRKSQRCCEQLDSAKGVEAPQETYFWPAELVFNGEEEEEDDEEDEEDEDDDEDVADKLRALTEYLRVEHYYCVWCGTPYDSVDDLSQHCPGDTAEAHDD